MIQNTMQLVSDSGLAEISDKVMLLAGLPLKSPYMINTIRVQIIGTVLARSSGGGHANPGITRARGRVIHAVTPQEAQDRLKTYDEGEILVCNVLTDEYAPILRMVSGVVCEDISEISEEQLRFINPRLVWLTHIRNATKTLESGLSVTIDAKQLLVYEGSV
jgi:pyruvate kinase